MNARNGAAGRLYAVALALLPRGLREPYGADMRRTFEDGCADASSRGRGALWGYVAIEIADLLAAAIRARWGAGRIGTERPGGDAASAHRTEGRLGMAALIADVRFGLRMLRREPAFAAVAVLTLAIGIGGTTAVFTVVNGVLLRPLPYRDPDRLALLLYGRPGRISPWFSPPNYLDFVGGTNAFDAAAAFCPATANLTGAGDPERVDGASVSWNFFDVLGARMALGRGFVEADANGGADAIVLSDGLWRRRFGARPDVVGTKAVTDGRPRVIVGVAPQDVRLPATAEFWQPLVFKPRDVAPQARGAQWVMVLARLRTDATVEQATTTLRTVAARLASDYPRTNGGATALATPLHERIVRTVRPTLLVLLGAVALVLLVACVNVANLLLARSQTREREVAVRAALGASRLRIVGQFLAESAILAVLGTIGGVAVAASCVRALAALAPASIPRLNEVVVDARVLAFALATLLFTTAAFGVVPAFSFSGQSVGRWLGVRGGGGARGRTARRLLVVSELALAVVLLVGAGLLLRSYHLLQQVAPGFNPDGVMTFNVSLPEAKYPAAADAGAFVRTLLHRLEAQPGVDSAAVGFGLPFASGFSVSTSFRRPTEVDTADSPSAAMRVVSPAYFRTLQIPLLAGRLFDARDDERAPDVILINHRMAEKHFADRDPIGQRLHVGVRLTSSARDDDKTIVGIVGDVKYGGLDEESPPEIYLPFAQQQVDAFTVAVRSAGDPAALAAMLRRETAAIDRELPLARLQPMRDLVDASVAERRFTMLLLASFAAVALALAAVGVYGVLAYLVSQRTQEIGVRLAMGATSDDVVRLFLREGVSMALVGLAAGAAGALAGARALTSLLFGVRPGDPITFAAVAAALAAAALLASYVPARRASKIDPITALRAE